MAVSGIERAARHREHRRAGNLVVTIAVSPCVRRALVAMGLIENGLDRDKAAVAWAAERFLAAAPGIATAGDAIYPEERDVPDE